MNYSLRDIHSQVIRAGLLERIARGKNNTVITAAEGFGAELLLDPKRAPTSSSESDDSIPAYPNIQDLRGLSAAKLKKHVHSLFDADTDNERAVVLVSPSSLKTWFQSFEAEHEIDVLGPDRLAYEPDEIRQVLQANYPGSVITHDLVNEVTHVTGGWPLLVDFVLEEASSPEELHFFLHSQGASSKATAFVQKEWKALTGISLKEGMVFGVVRHLDTGLLGELIGSQSKAEELLGKLSRASLLNPMDARRMWHPLLRDSIEHVAMARWPKEMKSAHLQTARYLQVHEPVRRAADILAHFVQANNPSDAIAHLEQFGDTLVDRMSSVRLLELMSSIEDDQSPLPLISTALLSRAQAVAGEWEDAREGLKRCERLLKDASLSPGERSIGYARVASVRAHMSWLKGVPTEANTYCQRAIAALQQASRTMSPEATTEAQALRLDLLELRATLTLQSGRYLKARELLTEIVSIAEESNHDSARLNAMKDLANLSMREGRLHDALLTFEKCSESLQRRSHAELFASVHTQKAHCHRLLGNYELARQSIQKSFTVRRIISPEGLTHALLIMAQIDAAMGCNIEAEMLFRRALSSADSTANSALRVRVRLWLCEHLCRNPEKLGEAESILVGMDSFVGNMERSYPVLAALKEMISGLIMQGQGEVAEAIALFAKAQMTFKKLHLPYYEALCYLHTASAHFARSQNGELSDSSRIRTFADRACAIANQHLFVFGRQESVIPLLETAAGIGAIETSRYLSRIRGIEFVPKEEQPVESETTVVQPGGQNCIITQEGLKFVDVAELEALMANMNKEILNIVIMGGKTNFIHKGVKQTGDLKRIIVPLLRTLLTNAGEEVKAPKLAAAVWGEGEYNQKARTRLKVAISRLRTLLSSDGKHLTTIPGKGPNRAENTGYRIERELEFLWLEKIS